MHNLVQYFPSTTLSFLQWKFVSACCLHKNLCYCPCILQKNNTTAVSTTTSVMGLLPIDFSNIDEFSCSTPKKRPLRIEDSKTKVDSLPVDLRLGLKLRLESPKRFFWWEKSKGIGKSF